MLKDDERDETLVRIDMNVQHLIQGRADHEERLRGLEKHKHYTLGFAAAVSAFISYFLGGGK